MNRYNVMIAGLLVLAGVMVFLTLRPSAPPAPETEQSVTAEGKRPSAPKKTSVTAERTKEAGRVKAAQAKASETESSEPDSPEAAPAEMSTAAEVPAAEAKTPREKAVERWESLVDQIIEQKDVPAADQAQRVKEVFDKLDKADQMDGIHRSLNLFPDEQFPALYAILYDKTEDPEVLDAIFSDALNRPEELKNPLMKELAKDKEHTCWFESVRILDVIGELDVKAPPAPAPTPTP
jgi:hypothetical protein